MLPVAKNVLDAIQVIFEKHLTQKNVRLKPHMVVIILFMAVPMASAHGMA